MNMRPLRIRLCIQVGPQTSIEISYPKITGCKQEVSHTIRNRSIFVYPNFFKKKDVDIHHFVLSRRIRNPFI